MDGKQPRMVRLFVSSTFDDFRAERERLQAEVFPELAKKCRGFDVGFEVVDLRWGISSESSEQETVEVCLAELQRCLDTGLRPSFLILLGDRYGWRPLPIEISTEAFRAITNRLEADGRRTAADFLRRFYPADENALTPCHRLVRANGQDLADHRARIQAVLREGAAGLPEADRLRLDASTTELEVEHGLLSRDGPADHALCCFRRIDRPASLGAPWVDVENGKRDADAAKRSRLLRRRVTKRLSGDRRRGFRTRVVRRRVRGEWTRAVQDSYLARFCSFVRRRLEADLDDQLARLERPPGVAAALADEVAAHVAFGERQASLFAGRRSERKRLTAFLARPQKVPLIVSGESGIGKSALVAKAIRDRPAGRRRTAVVERYLGATPASTRGESLIEGLLRQLGVEPRATSTARMQQLRDHLENRKEPLILALDAINQLTEGDLAENLQWLPARLPGELWLLVSAISGSRAERQLGRKYPNARRIVLSGLKTGESRALLDALLAARGRRLQPAQRGAVLEDHAARGSPLHLRIAAGEAATLRSGDPPWRPGPTVDAIVGQLLRRLSGEGSYGQLFLSRSLAYLATSRHGLSHDEIRHVLWQDRDVRREYRRLHRFSPKRSDSVAPLVWARLFRELVELLAFRHDQGEEVIGFFHDRVREAVERRIHAEDRPFLHGRLAAFFVPRRKEPFGPRAFSELVYQLAHAGEFRRLSALLGRADFVGESVSRHGTIPLTEDVDIALDLMERRSPEREPLEALRRSLAQSTHAVGESRGDVATQLLGRLAGRHPSTRALLRGLRGMVTDPWLRPLSDSLAGSGLERVLDLRPKDDFEVPAGEEDPDRFKRIWDLDLCPDRRTVLAAVHGGTVQMWDIRSGRLIAALVGHERDVESVCASRDGETAASVGGRELILWDLPGREVLRTPFKSRNRLFSVAITHRGDRIITGAGRGQITVWDALGEKPPWTVRPHKDLVWRLAVSRDDRYVASASQDGKLAITNLRSRKSRVVLDVSGGAELVRSVQLTSDRETWLAGMGSGHLAMGHARSPSRRGRFVHEVVVRDMAISSNDREVVSVSQDGVLATVTVPKLTPTLRVAAHSSEVNTVHLAADRRTLLTGSSDGFIKLWDLSTIKRARRESRHFFPIVFIGTLNNGRHVVSACSEGRAYVWDSRSFRHVRSIDMARVRIHQMELADKERLLVYVAGMPYGDRRLGHRPFYGDRAQLRVRHLRTGSEWSAGTGTEGRDSHFALVPGSLEIVSTIDDHDLAVSDLRTGQPLRRIRNVGYHVEQLLITPDERRLLVVAWSSDGYEHKRVLVFDLRTGRRERVLVNNAGGWTPRPRTGELRHIALLGSRRAVAGFDNGRIRAWDLHTGELERQLDAHEGGVHSIQVIGRQVLTTGADGHVRIWDARLWHEEPGLEGPVKGLRDARPSSKGQLVVGLSDDWSIVVWDRRTRKRLASFTANEQISCYRLLPDQRTIVVGEATGGLHFLRLER